TIALTTLKSQRSFRRDDTRLINSKACFPLRLSNFILRTTTTNKAIANKANIRDQAFTSLIRPSEKPNSHFTSRNPCSQLKRLAYSWAACLALCLRLLSRYHTSHLPSRSRTRLILTNSRCGELSQ